MKKTLALLAGTGISVADNDHEDLQALAGIAGEDRSDGSLVVGMREYRDERAGRLRAGRRDGSCRHTRGNARQHDLHPGAI